MPLEENACSPQFDVQMPYIIVGAVNEERYAKTIEKLNNIFHSSPARRASWCGLCLLMLFCLVVIPCLAIALASSDLFAAASDWARFR